MLKQIAYFSLIISFMEYGATVWDPYQKYISEKVERVQCLSKVGIQDTLVFLICFRCWGAWPPLFHRRQEARLILFYKIINALAQVPFESVLVEAYNGTRKISI